MISRVRQGAGIDRPQDSDLYYRLRISECFYVGGLGAEPVPEVITAETLREAEPDRLRACVPALIAQWNVERVRFPPCSTAVSAL